MYLKSIEVLGFKSFAQKILFEFHKGITAIVGPNGSGKSNVADAVRWVLGEQSAKQLRGGNMQDVIFSGTELRKPQSFASVAITLDNEDGALPVSYKEVTVTRRLYRSGDSEYLINGRNSRLKDVQELFYDTGIGKEGYSIIGQGQIDRILSGKPEERRELFDEAAGIVKYKRRKTATLKKLEDEETNLVRVTDILSELTRQVGPLEKQATAARAYLVRRDRQKILDVNLFLLENEKTMAQLQDLNEKLTLAQDNLSKTQQSYEEMKTSYEELDKALTELDGVLYEAQERTKALAVERGNLSGQVEVLKEKLSSQEKARSIRTERLKALSEEEEQTEKEREELLGGMEELQREQGEALESIREKEEALKKLQESQRALEETLQSVKNRVMEILSQRAKTEGKAQRFEALQEQLSIRKAQIAKRVLAAKAEEEKQKSSYEKAQEGARQAEAALLAIEEKTKKARQEVERLSQSLKEKTQELTQAQAAFHRESSRLESLQNLAERYDGYGNSIKQVMSQKEAEPGIHGVVADLIHVEQSYETAVETALGGSIQNIVTDDEQTAKRLIAFLKKNRYGRATFLPLSAISSKGGFGPKEALREKGAVGTADTLVKAEPIYKDLVANLLGRVLVVDGIDAAIAIQKKYHQSLRIVTLEGESLNPGGSMTGGAYKNNSNLLGRRREIEELQKKVDGQREKVEKLEASTGQLQSQRDYQREAIGELEKKKSQKMVEKNTQDLTLRSLEQQAEDIRQEYASIELDQQELRNDTKQLQSDQENLRQEREDSAQEEERCNAQIEETQGELSKVKEEAAQGEKLLQELRLKNAQSTQQESFTRESQERLQKRLLEIQRERDEIEESLKNVGAEQEKNQREIESLMGQTQKIVKEEEEATRAFREKKQERESLGAQHKEIFAKRDSYSEQMNLLDKECIRLKAQVEKQEEARDGRISYLWEEYELSPSQAEPFRDEEVGDLRAIKKELATLREEIKNLGPVNVSAIEEYKDVAERHEFLSSQYEDLKAAKENLEGIIRELEEGMRVQFTQKFKEIQQEYDKTFKELFGGGRGTLELEEAEDILEAGIRIIAQPPGKKLQNMMQLSGGEKALSAIALLFAIQNLKPSPFCLLDEIEAALDDSNVGRYAEYLQKLTDHTQFIVITHRRGTMNAADRLYGITMQEKGVSTLVSVDLVENELTG